MKTRIDDERFMALAIAEAAKGDLRPGAGEVGCVIVRDGQVAAAGYNETQLRYDPTAHAEIVTMRKLGRKLSSADFRGCTLHCTLQPCSMCTVACIWGKIGRIVFGAGRNDVHGMYFDTRHIDAADLVADAFRQDIEIVGGILAERCAKFYYRPSDSPPPDEQDNR